MSLKIHAHCPVVSVMLDAALVYALPVEKLIVLVVGVIVAVPAPMSQLRLPQFALNAGVAPAWGIILVVCSSYPSRPRLKSAKLLKGLGTIAWISRTGPGGELLATAPLAHLQQPHRHDR